MPEGRAHDRPECDPCEGFSTRPRLFHVSSVAFSGVSQRTSIIINTAQARNSTPTDMDCVLVVNIGTC